MIYNNNSPSHSCFCEILLAGMDEQDLNRQDVLEIQKSAKRATDLTANCWPSAVASRSPHRG